MQLCHFLHSEALPLQGLQTLANCLCSIRSSLRRNRSRSRRSCRSGSRGRSGSRRRSGCEQWHIFVRVSTRQGVEVNLPVSDTRSVGGGSLNRITSPIILAGRVEFIDLLNGNFQGIRGECCTKGLTCPLGLEHGPVAVCVSTAYSRQSHFQLRSTHC